MLLLESSTDSHGRRSRHKDVDLAMLDLHMYKKRMIGQAGLAPVQTNPLARLL